MSAASRWSGQTNNSVSGMKGTRRRAQGHSGHLALPSLGHYDALSLGIEHRAWGQPPSPHGFGAPRRTEDRRQKTEDRNEIVDFRLEIVD